MKKSIAISILLVFLSVAAFAQFKVGLTSDNTVDLFHFAKQTGDTADKEKVKGVFNFLNSNYWDGSELRLKLSYTGENFSALLVVKGDDLVNRGSGFYSKDGPTFNSFFDLPFDEWNVKGKAGILRGFVGNSSDRGKTSSGRYQNFNDFLKFKVDNFGVLLPGFTKTDTNNLKWGEPWLGFGLDFAPISIDIASDVVKKALDNPKGSGDRIAAVFRVSGDKVANIINFDAIYRIQGGDDFNQVRGSGGQWDNEIGVYANIVPNDALGFSVGYTAKFLATEKSETTNGSGNKVAVSYVNPFYSGIDLRACFTGVEKLKITFNNNISFAGADGDKTDTDKIIIGISGSSIGKGITNSWFALYNALGVNFAITEQLTATAQIGNLLGVTKTKNSGSESTVTQDKFEIALSALYAFNSYVSFEGGLAMFIDGSSSESTGSSKIKDGAFYLGVPLRFKVAF